MLDKKERERERFFPVLLNILEEVILLIEEGKEPRKCTWALLNTFACQGPYTQNPEPQKYC